MSLSTFSAHITNLVGILGIATDRTLVLVDSSPGTDPVEGRLRKPSLAASSALRA